MMKNNQNIYMYLPRRLTEGEEKVSKKWIELARKTMDHEDEIQKSYYGSLDGMSGYLVLSNKKMIFVQEKGLLRKTYNLVLDVPYEKLGKVSPVSRYELAVIEADGEKHVFTTDIPVQVIGESLKNLMEPKKD
ncbi:hypothetical protein CW700_07985 [Candidatus Bathyarchaeota archaeon]|nr:MAG: hypothetical protein CW700_07985 [Candidatus Bathyarchaeota archaeon]